MPKRKSGLTSQQEGWHRVYQALENVDSIQSETKRKLARELLRQALECFDNDMEEQ
jgi:hypothetical protein